MSVDSFKPEIWSQELRAAYEKALVFVSLCNRDYEGEIAKAGDIVHINTIGDPTVADYVPGTTQISAEEPCSLSIQSPPWMCGVGLSTTKSNRNPSAPRIRLWPLTPATGRAARSTSSRRRPSGHCAGRSPGASAPEQWREVGTNGPFDALLAEYAGHLCAACQAGLGEYERPQLDGLCEQALVASLEGLKGAEDVAAVLRSRLHRYGLAELVGDRNFEELRRAKRDKRRRGSTKAISECLPPKFAQPPGAAKSCEPASVAG